MAYHVSTRVLERMAGQPDRSLLASCVHHIGAADTSVSRHLQVGLSVASSALPAGVLERHIRELFALDLNPIAQMARRVRSMPAAVRAWNAVHNKSAYHVRWLIPSQGSDARRLAPRLVNPSLPNPVPCREVALGLLDVAMDMVASSARRPAAQVIQPGLSVSGLAQVLGQEGRLIQEASLFFESQPGGSVEELSRALGCSRRTLERQFREECLTAIELKRACALAGATRDLLWGQASLTEIAVNHGYADLAHMSKEIRRATGGLPPQLLRRLAWGVGAP